MTIYTSQSCWSFLFAWNSFSFIHSVISIQITGSKFVLRVIGLPDQKLRYLGTRPSPIYQWEFQSLVFPFQAWLLSLDFTPVTASATSIFIFRKDSPTCHMHPLSFRQIHTSVCYYKYSFFPMTIVLWNNYQMISSRFQILTPLNQESVRSITPFHFILILNSSH